MYKTVVTRSVVLEWAWFWGLAFLGAFFISLSSMVKIPFYPVSFTMHTFAVFLLAFTMKPRLALASVLLYLVLGTIGMPVFAGKVNTIWMMGKCAGYLFAFPIAAFMISKMLEKGYSIVWASLLGQLIIFSFGFFVLASFIGMKPAFTYGVTPFFFSDLLKIIAAYFTSRGMLWLRG